MSYRFFHALILSAAATALTGLSGCSTLGYYGQSVKGHLSVMAAAHPIEEVIEDPQTPEPLKHKLEEVLQIRSFASAHLSLPQNGSYQSYADIHRPYVVWNVFAAPELSLQPKQWCFLVVGCVNYRGYYKHAAAETFAATLREQHYDVYVAGIPAYSTLGWFNDPVLNTVIGWRDTQLAGLIFHELTHQKLFIKGDTVFNESFASAVEQVGVLRWLGCSKDADARADYLRRLRRREQFEGLLLQTRHELQVLYDDKALGSDAMRVRKQAIFEQMRLHYERLKQEWGGKPLYDAWFDAPVNNARFVAVSAYHEYVPAFLQLLEQQHGDLDAFFREAKKIGDMNSDQRHARLRELGDGAPTLESFAASSEAMCQE